MHTNHIAHLDLKPGNVLSSHKIDKYIVIDFGISEDYSEEMQSTSKTIDDFSAPSYACTPAYASPLARKSSDLVGDASCEHNPFKSDVFSLGLIMLELCAMQPNFSSLALNKEPKRLEQALSIFKNFSGQHIYKEESDELHVVLELQALLEWEEQERPNIICLALNLGLPCLFSAFSLPPDLFNKLDKSSRDIDWKLHFEASESDDVSLVDSKGRVVYAGGWIEGKPSGESRYALSEFYHIQGEITNLSYTKAEIKRSKRSSQKDDDKVLRRNIVRSSKALLAGKGFILSARGYLQRSQFMKRDISSALDVSETGDEKLSLKLAQMSLKEEILSAISSTADLVINIEEVDPALHESTENKYGLSLLMNDGAREKKVSIRGESLEFAWTVFENTRDRLTGLKSLTLETITTADLVRMTQQLAHLKDSF